MIELTPEEREKFAAYCEWLAKQHDLRAQENEAKPGHDGVVANNDRKRSAIYASMVRLLRNP
jgi:hypothetical protein